MTNPIITNTPRPGEPANARDRGSSTKPKPRQIVITRNRDSWNLMVMTEAETILRRQIPHKVDVLIAVEEQMAKLESAK